MGKQIGFYFDTDRCVQCHACEVACKSWNGIEPGIRWRRVLDAWSGQFPNVENQTISYSCMHCEKPACIAVCPKQAISKRAEDGIVVVDQNKCIGCRSCSAACPFHIPQYGRTGLMQKCDLCVERLASNKPPACVATCPGEALKYGPIEASGRLFAADPAKRLSASTAPAFFISGRMTGPAFLALLDTNGHR
ncbi:MAG: 4Fe-4S dicluster domain-containing protein [Acidobacteria bacterium]|nr:4Fe-4S dicluster domain-containing protein [Acidobacteriota bacterium]